MPSNFDFLQDSFPHLANWGALAEKYVRSDPAACLYHLGRIAETFTLFIFKSQNVPYPEKNDHCNRINALFNRDYIDGDVKTYLHSLRRKRNDAAHSTDLVSDEEKTITTDDARKCLELTHYVCQWLYQTYVDQAYQQQAFVLPEENAPIQLPDPKELSDEEIEKLIAESDKRAQALKKLSREERRKRIQSGASQRPRTEAETRVLIDAQLRQVGWEADTDVVRYSKGVRPQKGRNLAIAEWPTLDADGEEGRADYALFVGEKLYAIVEAKASRKDVSSVVDGQGNEYPQNVRPEDQKYLLGEWNNYKIPFVFATNGRPYLEQLHMQSGVWFRDLRRPQNVPRPLRGWISPQGLVDLFERDDDAANARLLALSDAALRDPDGLNLRDYQIAAIKAAENAVLDGKDRILLAMATGTGKTRTVLGMIFRFLKSQRFKRILFLVDRTSLGEQAIDVFKEVKLEDLMKLSDLYEIKGLEEATINKETRVQVATVQSMVKRVLYNADDWKPSVTDYDLVVVDEAHRGYILDKEMSEAELFCRNQLEFQSKYRSVIDYFEGVKIGLTATPALQTTQIFGRPVFKYTYRQAVIDGWLVDHDAPHQLITKLSLEGLRYKKGDAIRVKNLTTGEVVESELLKDELDFEVDEFNRKVVVDGYNKAVLEEIAKDFDPSRPNVFGKMLIYAVDDKHADTIVALLKEIYAEKGVDASAIMKITGAAGEGDQKLVRKLVRRFKNEDYPSVAVTVDLLTTGIDVPKITKLVFLRRVKSRILFEQMLGRATRRCPEIGKTHFEIYDPVGIYEALDDVNTMKPAVANPSSTFTQLVDALEGAETPEQIDEQVKQILAKLQRVKPTFDKETIEQIEDMTDGKSPEEFVQEIKNAAPEDAKDKIIERRGLFEFLQTRVVESQRLVVLSDSPDQIVAHTRGYGDKNRPEDYLKAFSDYLKTNKDKIEALNIVCSRPKDLTRKALKSLSLTLDREGFTIALLNEAVSKVRNEQIVADIVGLIRTYALGAVLLNHEDKVRVAMEKVKTGRTFSESELKWLDRIEKYLLKNSVVNESIFDEDVRFKADGGFARINRIFGNRLGEIVAELNEYLYNDGGSAA